MKKKLLILFLWIILTVFFYFFCNYIANHSKKKKEYIYPRLVTYSSLNTNGYYSIHGNVIIYAKINKIDENDWSEIRKIISGKLNFINGTNEIIIDNIIKLDK